METSHKKFKILMFPWLAHGHVSPFLELAKRLSRRNFHVYFYSTSVNLNNSVKPEIFNGKGYSHSIDLVELHLPPLPDLPPDHHTTRNLPPHLTPRLKQAFDMSSPEFSDTLRTLNPDLIIYDTMQPWASAIASEQNIPAIVFITTGAAMASFMVRQVEENPGMNYDFPFLFPAFLLHDYETPKMIHVAESVESFKRSTDMVLIKSFREIEGKYIDYLSFFLEKKVVPVGPLVVDEEGRSMNTNKEEDYLEIIDWLNRKDPCSTVFVSFGSELFLSKKAMDEIALGLELSGVNFMWVVRSLFQDSRAFQEAFPIGFLERVRDKGKVLEGWAPQGRILGHKSIGGFVSHCGWSSVMEGMKNGVPIVAVPLQNDEPINARLLAADIGMAVEVARGVENGKMGREAIAIGIKEVMVSKNGEEVRRRARGLSERIRMKGEEEIDSVVEELSLLLQ